MMKKEAYGFWSICLFFFLSFVNNALAFEPTGNAYLNQLIEKAKTIGLENNRYWDILLHYKPTLKGKESLIDDPRFFLAAKGKNNPQAELIATIQSLFLTSEVNDDNIRCRFPARYLWLKEMLSIDETKLPVVSCSILQKRLQKIEPHKAVLIFPSPYIRSSGSMFGHTLLRIDGKADSNLLSYAVNYSATVPHGTGVTSYVYKGLSGGFNGYYSIAPYYAKIKEYNDLEQRDIWEYELNLDPQEVQRMVLHILELQDIYTKYYFFSENCSFNLLFLLESARPTIELTRQYWNRPGFWVIPSDTIEVISNANVVTKINYRPALASVINYYSSRLNLEYQKIAYDIAEGRLKPQFDENNTLTIDDKVRILNLATQYVQYRYTKMELDQKDYQEKFLSIIKEKNINSGSLHDREAIAVLKPPSDGHLPGTASVKTGYANDALFAELGYRPAYHSINDPPAGYMKGEQLNFLDLRVRYYEKESVLKLQSFQLLDIISVSPRTMFIKPISWKFNTGFNQQKLRDGDDHLIYRMNGGGGVAYNSDWLGLYYGMIEGSFIFSNQLQDKMDIGIGFTGGTIKQLNEQWQVNLQLQWLYYALSENCAVYHGNLFQTFTLSRNNAIILHMGVAALPGLIRPEISITWNHYF